MSAAEIDASRMWHEAKMRCEECHWHIGRWEVDEMEDNPRVMGMGMTHSSSPRFLSWWVGDTEVPSPRAARSAIRLYPI